MRHPEFDNLRLAVKVNGFTTWQLILLFGDIVGRLCDCEEFEPMKKELSDMEEVLVESLDKYEDAKPYAPDPADLAREKETA